VKAADKHRRRCRVKCLWETSPLEIRLKWPAVLNDWAIICTNLLLFLKGMGNPEWVEYSVKKASLGESDSHRKHKRTVHPRSRNPDIHFPTYELETLPVIFSFSFNEDFNPVYM